MNKFDKDGKDKESKEQLWICPKAGECEEVDKPFGESCYRGTPHRHIYSQCYFAIRSGCPDACIPYTPEDKESKAEKCNKQNGAENIIKIWIDFCKEDMELHPDWYDSLYDAMMFHRTGLVRDMRTYMSTGIKPTSQAQGDVDKKNTRLLKRALSEILWYYRHRKFKNDTATIKGTDEAISQIQSLIKSERERWIADIEELKNSKPRNWMSAYYDIAYDKAISKIRGKNE